MYASVLSLFSFVAASFLNPLFLYIYFSLVLLCILSNDVGSKTMMKETKCK